MRKLKDICLALIPAIIVFVLVLLEPFYSIDAMVCDRLYSQMDGFNNNIKIICIDEETLAEYGPLTTWSRDKSADLIEYLYEDRDNHPAVLAFDMMFIGEGNSETDHRLAEAMGSVENGVVATNLVYRGKRAYTEGGVPYYDLSNIESIEEPYEELRGKVSAGYANAQIAKDGFVRVARTSIDINGKTEYSFATQVFKQYVEVAGKQQEIHLPEQTLVQFFYSGKPGECEHYSLKDVLSDKLDKRVFKDAIVFVGAYAPGLQDSYHNSAQRGQDMYGVEINANITNALLTGKTATKVPVLLVAIISAIVMFAYTYASRIMKMYPAILVGVWILIADGIIGRLLATHGHLISMIYVPLVCMGIWAAIIIEKYVIEAVQRRQTLNSFKKYMAPQVIDNLAKSGEFHIELGGEKRHIAVLFVDIRGFTTLSELLQPEQMVSILNRYLSLTTECIFHHGGMLDKFIGDATMAIFNAPNDQEDYVFEAVMAALEMQERGNELGKKLSEEFGREVSFGVGVHTGDAVVGNIGCDTRMDYTAIGDTVNTASRIEGKAKGGEVLISEKVYEQLKDRLVTEFREAMALKGKMEPVNVYRVLGVK